MLELQIRRTKTEIFKNVRNMYRRDLKRKYANLSDLKRMYFENYGQTLENRAQQNFVHNI